MNCSTRKKNLTNGIRNYSIYKNNNQQLHPATKKDRNINVNSDDFYTHSLTSSDLPVVVADSEWADND